MKFRLFLLVLMLFNFLFISALTAATSKRVEVFERTQAFHDVQPGETLGQICTQYYTYARQRTCMLEVVADNPTAFINQSPDKILAGKRIWLPGGYHHAATKDAVNYSRQQFSWGYIKTPK